MSKQVSGQISVHLKSGQVQTDLLMSDECLDACMYIQKLSGFCPNVQQATKWLSRILIHVQMVSEGQKIYMGVKVASKYPEGCLDGQQVYRWVSGHLMSI